MSLSRKIKDPSDVIVEKTAGEFAGLWYDAARSSGMTVVKLQGNIINLLKYKSPREFARRHLEKFIPAAVHSLIEIMSRPNCPEDQKLIIYNAIMERVNDQDLDMMAKTAGDMPTFEQSVLYKPDTELPKPVIVNTPSIDFDFNSKKVDR
jgi:hypothetical protein